MSITPEEIRYWPRIGMYVNREFATEWIERLGITGRVLDEDIEEFIDVESPTAGELEKEIKEIFAQPFEAGELTQENEAIMNLIEFERGKKAFVLSKKGRRYDIGRSQRGLRSRKGGIGT